jgi:alpha-L-fucosidase
MKRLSKREYEAYTAATRDARMAWFRQARFGMFIHYGLYSELGTGEWSQANENYTVAEYEALANRFAPKEGCAREWCALAKAAGAKYVVLTTRHHEGFSLWDSKVNPYNSWNYCGRDIVREFVEACREYGLKIGLYSSLMDWHHPDSWRCANDPEARMRFNAYIDALNTELLTNYGKIDLLWYDVSCPMEGHESWDSVNRNYKYRQLQPDIIINDRSALPEDFDTPEQTVRYHGNRDWEGCMTLTGLAWGYVDYEQAHDFMMTPKNLIRTLHLCTCGAGNLLLNIGPMPDGTVPPDTVSTLTKMGEWLAVNGAATYGYKFKSGPVYSANTLTAVSAEQDGKTIYLWNWVWPKNGTLRIGGYMDAPKKISYLATGESIDFEADGHRIILRNLPAEAPDNILGVTVLKMEFEEAPRHRFRSYYPQMWQGTDLSDGYHVWAETEL